MFEWSPWATRVLPRATLVFSCLAVLGCGRVGFQLLPVLEAEPPGREAGVDAGSDDAGMDAAPGEAGVDAAPGEAGVDAAPGEAGVDAAPGEAGMDAAPGDAAPECTCTNDHGTTACVAGSCEPTCSAGYDDCDDNPDNGCETDVLNDPSFCGSCTRACEGDDLICVEGACEASPCPTGLGECDGDLGVTCETDLETDLDHCGFCNNACALPNSTAECVAGSCEVQQCDTGYDDCDGDPDNGCETPLDTTSDCGSCGQSCPANGGIPVCDAGTCDTRCDLTGTFALYMRLSGSWPRDGVIDSGSGTFEFWMRVDASHSGDEVDIQLTECGRTIPPFGAWQVNEDFLYGYPNGLFDGGWLPSSAGVLSLGDSSPDSSLSLPLIATQMGIDMDDPVGDSWPSSASGIPTERRIDMDEDGRPGVTATYSNGGPYIHPRTSSSFFGYNRADRAHVASRVSFALSGALSGCTQSGGDAIFTHVDTRIFDCRRSGGGDCNSSEADFLDDNAQNYSLGDATYTMTKVANGAACPAIRSALP